MLRINTLEHHLKHTAGIGGGGHPKLRCFTIGFDLFHPFPISLDTMLHILPTGRLSQQNLHGEWIPHGAAQPLEGTFGQCTNRRAR